MWSEHESWTNSVAELYYDQLLRSSIRRYMLLCHNMQVIGLLYHAAVFINNQGVIVGRRNTGTDAEVEKMLGRRLADMTPLELRDELQKVPSLHECLGTHSLHSHFQSVGEVLNFRHSANWEVDFLSFIECPLCVNIYTKGKLCLWDIWKAWLAYFNQCLSRPRISTLYQEWHRDVAFCRLASVILQSEI